MNSRQIEYFLSAAKHLSFTKISEEFFTTQPTVSRQVALLEEELGFELFTRYKGKLRLTAGGAIMVQVFSKTNQMLEDAIKQVGRINEGLEGELSIGYLTGTNTDNFIHPSTTAFLGKFPTVKVSMESSSFAGMRRKLDSGEFDIVYTTSFELPEYSNISFLECYKSVPIIVMSSSHPLAKIENPAIKDISGETFLLPSPSETNLGRLSILNLLKEHGVTNLKFRDENNLESLLFNVRSGIGVALLDTCMDCIYDNRYSSIPIPLGSGANPMSVVAVWKEDNSNPMIPIYLEFLKERYGG